MRLKIIILSLFLLIVFSCALDKPIKTEHVPKTTQSNKFYLPGVDSTVVRDAVLFSDRIVVDFDRRQKASKLFERGKNSFEVAESIWQINLNELDNDSIVLKLYENWRENYQSELSNSKVIDEIKSTKRDRIGLLILDSAYNDILKAKTLNPFDLEIRSLIIKIFLKYGEISHNATYYRDAIDELNNFLLVDKSNPYIYEKLGECYYALGDWDKSYKYFHEAEKILKIVSVFKYDADQKITTSFDTTRWIYYLRRQGEAKAKLYDSDLSIYYLAQAKLFSKSDSSKQDLQNILNWINWDDGNIRAAEIKDEILKIEDNRDYKKARSEYLKLLPQLRTQKPRNEINWKIASIEYNQLDRKKDAISRLFQVIQNVKTSQELHPLHAIYLKDYAAMCYAIGMEYFKENSLRLAYIYLYQASQINWQHKGECFFQLAILSRENPAETIRNCKEALNYSKQLSDRKIKQIYEMLAISYKRMGEFNLADNYFQNSVNYKNSTQN